MKPPSLSSLAGVFLATGIALSSCTAPTSGSARPSTSAAGAITGAVTYAAIGASETVGIGTRDHLRQAWPQIFFNSALPESAVFYNFGLPGATTAEALDQELPAALHIHPTLVTIWLNVNDLFAGVPPSTYEAQLQLMVTQLRAAGTREILIANTPELDRLPAYLACTADNGFHCPFPGAVPSAAELNAMVDAYNAAISRVATQASAVVVDLHAQGEVPDLHPEYVSADGLHPNAEGYGAIAAAFKAALARQTH